nr:MAG TPA: hypothetical protein [Caudoviricetes sp.]
MLLRQLNIFCKSVFVGGLVLFTLHMSKYNRLKSHCQEENRIFV